MHDSILAEHAQHDLDLIAGHAAGDLTDAERLRADAVLQSCTSCADLRRELVTLPSATRTLSRMAPAPRDFRIDAATAAQLRRGGWFRSLLRPFGAPRSPVRPMAMAFTSLGLAGLLIGNLATGGFLGRAASGPVPAALERLGAGSDAAATSAPVVVPVAGMPRPSGDLVFGVAGQASPGSDVTGTKAGDSSSAPPVANGGGTGTGTEEQPTGTRDSVGLTQTPTNPFILASIALLGIGLALFALRFVARRVH